ncbi:hypothetical protein EI94DRAFT_1754657 [Lactarius quietus]|nr:hypothetical protein EI94DRAFT_1754657 [Lactarius quietus]
MSTVERVRMRERAPQILGRGLYRQPSDSMVRIEVMRPHSHTSACQFRVLACPHRGSALKAEGPIYLHSSLRVRR